MSFLLEGLGGSEYFDSYPFGMFQLLAVLSLMIVSFVGAGSARPLSPVVILLSQRAGKPRPYEACHLGSYFSSSEPHLLPVLISMDVQTFIANYFLLFISQRIDQR